jgi:hypothetical protein
MQIKTMKDIILPELGQDFVERVIANNQPVHDLRSSFEKKRYLIVRQFLQQPLPTLLFRYAALQAQIGATESDDQVPGCYRLYGDPVMESLLELCRPAMEVITGLMLIPTYAYCRIYNRDDVLKAHKDRPSCEISATLTLGHDLESIRKKDPLYSWPIVVEGKAFTLEPGEMLIYRGCELSHWREAFQGDYQAQLFLHYVDANGPFASKKYDTRPALGLPEFTKGASSIDEARARIQKKFKVDAVMRIYRQQHDQSG